jgi:hypothetical protein
VQLFSHQLGMAHTPVRRRRGAAAHGMAGRTAEGTSDQLSTDDCDEHGDVCWLDTDPGADGASPPTCQKSGVSAPTPECDMAENIDEIGMSLNDWRAWADEAGVGECNDRRVAAGRLQLHDASEHHSWQRSLRRSDAAAPGRQVPRPRPRRQQRSARFDRFLTRFEL